VTTTGVKVRRDVRAMHHPSPLGARRRRLPLLSLERKKKMPGKTTFTPEGFSDIREGRETFPKGCLKYTGYSLRSSYRAKGGPLSLFAQFRYPLSRAGPLRLKYAPPSSWGTTDTPLRGSPSRLGVASFLSLVPNPPTDLTHTCQLPLANHPLASIAGRIGAKPTHPCT